MQRKRSDSKVSIERGLFNLAVGNTVERSDFQEARHELTRGGCDPMKDVGVATSGSHGVKTRTFTRWDAKERRQRKWFYDAMSERWVEQDTRPAWRQDLDAVRARLAAKGKLPKGVRS